MAYPQRENELRVLVTGATGFIGSHLVERLLLREHEVLCLVRKTSVLKHLKKIDVKIIYGDLTDKKSLKNQLNTDADVVFHLAGILGEWGIPEEAYWKINVEGTKNTLDLFTQTDIKRFVYSSSAGVLGPLKKPPADENFPLNPSNIYERTKAEAEKIVLACYYATGFPITIVRPEFVYGQRDMHTLGLFKAIQKGMFQIVGDGNSTLHPTYIDDLIQGFELCIDKQRAIGEIYMIAGERYVTVRELTIKIAKALQVRPPTIDIPIWLANTMAFMMETSAHIFNFQPPLTRSRVRFFTQNRGCDISKARRELGYEPMIILEEGLKRTVDWYRKNGYL